MTEQKNSPVLRFPGFDSNWSKKRLKKIADINPKSKQNRPEQFNYIDLESVKQGRIINISKVSKDNAPSRAQRIAQKQDIFFQTVRPYQQNNFIYNFDVDDVVVSTGYAQFRTINHKYYIFTLLHTYRFLVNVLLNCTGSNYPAINSTDLSNIEVYITENKLEQEKIGNFFSKLDCQIELEEKKLELLEQQKKGYIQKIFSQELRFKDENGNNYPNWEMKKLGNIANIVGGGTPSTKKSEYWDGDINWFSPVEIGDKEFVSTSQRRITEKGLEKSSAKVLPIGTVLFTSRAGIGKTAILSKEATTNQGFQSIVPKENDLDSYFLYSMTSILKRNAEKVGAGSTFSEVSRKQMEQIKLLIPILKEQKQIGRLFQIINRKINKQIHKIELLKQRKKGLLQKMFI